MNELTTPETIGFLERVVRDPSIDVNKLEQIIALQERIASQQAARAFNLAMSRVDGEIGPVIRDRLNPGVNRKYATLEAIDAVARPVYSANGISVRFGCAQAPLPGWMRITCTVSHADGYSETNYLDVPVDAAQRGRTPVQGVGANITYARRYLLQMCFNIVLQDDEADDDGEATRRDRQADRAYPASDARSAINAAVPLNPAPPKPARTPAELLDGLELAMKDCGTLDAVNRLIANRHVQDMLRDYHGDDRARLQGIVAAGIAAHAPVVHPDAEADIWGDAPVTEPAGAG
jgi:hypothetical protein